MGISRKNYVCYIVAFPKFQILKDFHEKPQNYNYTSKSKTHVA